MMRKFNRGTTVDFSTTFYDKDGDVTEPDTATLYVAFPGFAWPSFFFAPTPVSGWPLNGYGLQQASVAMTMDSDGNWTASWDSSVSQPGLIYYHIRASDPNLTTEDGQFELRGNPANLTVS